MNIKEYWKSLTTQIKVAIIGGIFAIIAAIIGGLFSIDFVKKGELEIIEVDLIDEVDRKRIETVIYNGSEKEIPLTSIELKAYADGLLNTIGSISYKIEDLVITDSTAKNIEGTIRRNHEQIKRGIHGEIKFLASGGWKLALNLSIRESIKAGESKSLFFLLPTEIKIKDVGSSFRTTVFDNGVYFVGDPPNKFKLEKFFTDKVQIISVVANTPNGQSKFKKKIK